MRRRTIIAIAVPIVLIVAAVIVLADLNGGSLDFSGRDVRLIITDSMDGERTDHEISTIPKNSLVMVRSLSGYEKYSLKEGDVIQFWYFGILDHHRVVENDTEKMSITTKGDNSPVTELVPYEDITGIVVGVNHPLGEIVNIVKVYWVTVIAFVMAACVAINAIVLYRKGELE